MAEFVKLHLKPLMGALGAILPAYTDGEYIMQENTFKAYMQLTYSHNELADMANHGANTGHNGLIWTRDLVALYDEHGEALHALLADYKDETGELPKYVLDNMDDVDTFKSSVVYFGAEWVASNITQGEYIDENTPEVAEYIGE